MIRSRYNDLDLNHYTLNTNFLTKKKLHSFILQSMCPCDGTGRRNGLKIRGAYAHGGSIPPMGTTLHKNNMSGITFSVFQE